VQHCFKVPGARLNGYLHITVDAVRHFSDDRLRRAPRKALEMEVASMVIPLADVLSSSTHSAHIRKHFPRVAPLANSSDLFLMFALVYREETRKKAFQLGDGLGLNGKVVLRIHVSSIQMGRTQATKLDQVKVVASRRGLHVVSTDYASRNHTPTESEPEYQFDDNLLMPIILHENEDHHQRTQGAEHGPKTTQSSATAPGDGPACFLPKMVEFQIVGSVAGAVPAVCAVCQYDIAKHFNEFFLNSGPVQIELEGAAMVPNAVGREEPDSVRSVWILNLDFELLTTREQVVDYENREGTFLEDDTCCKEDQRFEDPVDHSSAEPCGCMDDGDEHVAAEDHDLFLRRQALQRAGECEEV